jgi:3-keto steroid reductase
LLPSGSSSTTSREKAAKNASIPTYDGLTLILACRSIKRANAARQELLRLLEREVHALKKAEGYDGHAEMFAKNVQLVVHQVDLAEVKSVFYFVQGIKSS